MDDQASNTTASAGKTAAASKDPAPVVEAAPEAAPETTAAKVRRWMDENLAGGPVARDVECWNAIHEAIPALVGIIDG